MKAEERFCFRISSKVNFQYLKLTGQFKIKIFVYEAVLKNEPEILYPTIDFQTIFSF